MSAPTLVAGSDQSVAFDCFGGNCAISVADRRRPLAAAAAAARASGTGGSRASSPTASSRA